MRLRTRQSFLLIVRTRHIVTIPSLPDGIVARDTRMSQHIAEFCNSLDVDRYSYGRRLPGLSFSASGQALTPPRNLPAPGRRQPLYVVFRLSRDLCFW
jgi:hypothetical protein